MVGKVHLRLPTANLTLDTQLSWLHIPDKQNLSAGDCSVMQGTLRDFAETIGNDLLVVYIPALDVLQMRVHMPAGRQSQLLKALPFALEDDLIDDVDSLHCVLGPRLEDGRSVAAVINKDLFEQYLTGLRQVGLQPRHFLPETLLLPWQADHWSVYCSNDPTDNNQLIVRSGLSEGFVCHKDALAGFLQQALNNKEAIERVELYNGDTQLAESLDSLPVAVTQNEITSHYPDDVLALLLQHGETVSKLNLLQGDYAPVSRIKQQLRPWYKVAAMAAVLVLLGLVNNNVEYHQLKTQSDRLHQQMVQVLRRTFPTVKQTGKLKIHPYKYFNSEYEKINLSGSEQGFNLLLAQITPVATKTERLAVRHLRYRDGRMELMLELPDLQTLESLKQRLAEATSLKVELKSANTTDNKVQGRIVISKS